MAGFKKAIITNRDVNALNAARLALQRPTERALLGLFMYRPDGLKRVSPSPTATIQSLAKMPHVRATLSEQWEAALRPLFPDIDLVHALAVLHWWDAQSGLEPQRWAAAIGYWVTVCMHPHLARLLPGQSAPLATEIENAVVTRLRSTIERNGRGSAGLQREAVLLLDSLEVEVRAARALRASGFQANGTVLSSGPQALARVGMLESLRKLIDSQCEITTSEKLQKVRGLLSPLASIEVLIERTDFEQAQARLERVAPCPAVDALRVRVSRARARQASEAGDIATALAHWKEALARTTAGPTRDEVAKEASNAARQAVERLDKNDVEGRVRLLDRAYALTSDADVKALLGEALVDRGIKRLPDRNDCDTSNLRLHGETVLARQLSGAEDFERAAGLGVQRAYEFARKTRENYAALQRMVEDARRPPSLSQEGLLFDDDYLDDEDEDDEDDDEWDGDGHAWLMHQWTYALPSLGCSVSFSDSNRTLAAGHGGGTTLLQVGSGTPVQQLNDDGYIQAVLFSPFSDNYLFEGSDTGSVGMWTLETPARYSGLDSGGEVVGFAISADWRWLAVLRKDLDSLRVVSPLGEEGHDITTLEKVTAVAAFHTSNRWILGLKTELAICDVDERLAFDSTETDVYAECLAVSPDDRLIAVGDLTGEIAIVRASDLQIVRTIEAHDNIVSSLAFSPDGTLLLSGSSDGTVKLFSVASGDEKDCESHGDWVRGVAFSPDGKYAASIAFSDKTVKVWRIDR